MNAVRRARRTGDCLSSPPPSEPSAATACGARTRRTLPRAAGLLLAFVALLAAPMAAQAQTTNICGRTQQVQSAILVKVGHAVCANVPDIALISDLNLSFQNILSLQSDDFSGLTGLTVLNLDNNQLSSLPEDIFSDLTALTLLNLDHNQLRNLPEDIFSGLTRLRELYLNNQLRNLPEDIFSGLTGLTVLTLNNNQLSNLPAGVFSGLTGLTTLYLNDNQLFSLPDGIFSGLTTLTTLNLRNQAVNPMPIEVSLEGREGAGSGQSCPPARRSSWCCRSRSKTARLWAGRRQSRFRPGP